MPRFAEDTKTTPASSKTEIENAIRNAGGELVNFLHLDPLVEAVMFCLRGRWYRIPIPHPPEMAGEAEDDPAWLFLWERWQVGKYDWAEYRQREIRRRWRVALLTIKTRLEEVAGGDIAPERAFLAYALTPTGETVGDVIEPQIAAMYDGSAPPARLSIGVTPTARLAPGEGYASFRELPEGEGHVLSSPSPARR